MAQMSFEKRFSRLEISLAAVYALILVWVNAYICRELFLHEAAHMNSMQGFWAGLARLGPGSWIRPMWWPFWDCGIPFEFTYAPLIPGLTAACAAARGVPHTAAFQSVSGFFFCLLPVTLFLMAWLLTRAPGYSFLAGLFYSLTAPIQLVVPDDQFSLIRFWDARRFYLAAVWDETPHFAALSFLPLVVLFLSLSIQRRRLFYYVASALAISLAALASAFGSIVVAMAALCLLCVLRREDYRTNLAITIGIGAFAYALAAPFVSPSVMLATRDSSASSEGGWHAGSVTALAITALGWTILWRYLPRWTSDWRIQFFALFAYLTTSVPFLATFLRRQYLPQPNRYKNEAELALSLFVVFAAKKYLEKTPVSVRIGLLFAFLAIAGEQVVSHRRFAKDVFRPPHDPSKTIEYRASRWVAQNLPGVRVMMPGSVAQWSNAFAEVMQFSGSSWSMAYNQTQMRALRDILAAGETPAESARISLAWLRAYGVGAIGISRPNSAEFWKPFRHPSRFDGVLPPLWSEEGVTFYQVSRGPSSLAHVIPESELVRYRGGKAPELAAVERYVAALGDPSIAPAQLEWLNRSRIRIRAAPLAGQGISVQVSYHPGWHAKVNGQTRKIERDALGLMWVTPQCDGPCELELNYDGGWELRVCRYLSFAAATALVLAPVANRLLKARP